MRIAFIFGLICISGILEIHATCSTPRSITRLAGSGGNNWATGYTGALYTATFDYNPAVSATVGWSVTGGASPAVPADLISSCGGAAVTNNGFSFTCSVVTTSSTLATMTTNLTAVTGLSTNVTAKVTIGGNECTQLNSLLVVEACPNITTTGVVQDVPSNAAFGSTHTFTCSSNYVLSTGAASLTSTCQADATWSPIPVCNQACDTTTIPSNTSYVSPSTSELIVVGSSKDLNCTSGYPGNASAVCNAAGDTRSWTVTNGCKAVCSQLSADYCVHGTNTSVTTVTEGSDVNVGCCNGKIGSATAVCATPGNITLSLDCSQVCNTSSLPLNEYYSLPSPSQLVVVGNMTSFDCKSGYNGSAHALCMNTTIQTWNITNKCKAVCVVSSSEYCISGATNESVIEGSDVEVICCNLASRNATASCLTPGNLSLTLDCAPPPTTTPDPTTTTPTTTDVITTRGVTSSYASPSAAGRDASSVTTTTTAATTVTTTTIVAATTTSAFAATTTSKGLTGGQIAGIVIGVLLGIALIGGLVWFFVFRDQNK